MESHSSPTSAADVRIAVVDDDPRILTTLATYLRQLSSQVCRYSTAADCLAALHVDPPDIIITDIRMPGIDGLSLLKQVKGRKPETDVIMMSGTAEKADAIRALRLGAFDFFEKPVDGDELLETVKRTIRYRSLQRERDRLAGQVSFLSQRDALRWGIKAFVGNTPAVSDCIREIRLLQNANRTAVLITGESGTGKELVARAIHYGGSRSARPFVPVNCSAVPKDLAESTLFGHTKGAFTGATSDQKGCFQLADGGTLFLDEIGDMIPDMQTKLLRVLEDGVVQPVGASTPTTVDVRVVAATNADLDDKIRMGQFRRDLFYRLAVFRLQIPPLRERRSDIPLLVDHFVYLLSEEMGIARPEVADDALTMLMAHDYPGNVRELRNIVERALIESGGKAIRRGHIHIHGAEPPAAELAAAGPQVPVKPDRTSVDDDTAVPVNLAQAEVILIKRALNDTGGNMAAAARLLGISRPKLYRKMASQSDPGHAQVDP